MDDRKKLSIISLLFFTLELALLELQILLEKIHDTLLGYVKEFSIWSSFFSVALIISGGLSVFLYCSSKRKKNVKNDSTTEKDSE